MEIPGRRSNYSLLAQLPAEHQQRPKFSAVESLSSDTSKQKTDRPPFDWLIEPNGRIGSNFPSIGLQRQSSGSSFGEPSLSGDHYLPILSAASASDPELLLQEEGLKAACVDARPKAVVDAGAGGPSSSSSKSWAQHTEESYQLQLALALRLSLDATSADDPNFLCSGADDSSVASPAASAESLSHRFWVNGSLSYYDKVPDGFYLIHGMEQYVWTVCTNLQENGRVPSIESLRSVDPSNSSVKVLLIDKRGDPGLMELETMAFSLSGGCATTVEVVDQLAKLVCSRMGGTASTEKSDLVLRWKECIEILKDRVGSIVLPMGSLAVGLCRHRALLFKVLADSIDLPCRVAKGCKYCCRQDASSCLVRFGFDREYLIDLIGNPGFLSEPDSVLNGPSSVSICSPLRLPIFASVETTDTFRSLAKQYFSDCQSLSIIFGDASDATGRSFSKPFDRNTKYLSPNSSQNDETKYLSPNSSKNDDTKYLSPTSNKNDNPQFHNHGDAFSSYHDKESHLQKLQIPSRNGIIPQPSVGVQIPPKPIKQPEHREIPFALSDLRADKSKDQRHNESVQRVTNKSGFDFSFDVDDSDIPWSDLVLKERIGAGSFGTVHRADWHGSEVAVKILMEQDFLARRFKEFLREVAIMKRLRHPNIVLFMGAVTQPPNLSIVTEYLSRGSLYRLLHRPGAREMLDEKRRLNMAYDVAKGMNYLHRRNPPIVHRDLKSPNLLVDRKFTVKVCDFGLSRLKENTFLSSKTATGTPEWMAPEVLRDDPSNEKSDVYSFGVILWELVTMQQPWSSLNPAQVVAAVGFKNKRLEIPRNVNPQVSALIESCWVIEPWKRPCFSSIMNFLEPLIKSPTPQLGHAEMSQLA
ncbi:hypothetical protein AAC387_Pa07g2010 [Persea americana]